MASSSSELIEEETSKNHENNEEHSILSSVSDSDNEEKDSIQQKPFGDIVIRLRNIYKHYTIPGRDAHISALEDVTLDDDPLGVRRGEFMMIRGPSGGGKTTLLNMIGTIDRPSGGEIELLQNEISRQTPDYVLADLRLRRVGFVFQTFNLLATMSAFENVELPMTLLGEKSKKERRRRTKYLLKLVGLKDRMNHLPSELSGGEQQRVTIARALANEPEILLLDEPTGDLDTLNTVDIMNLLLDINLGRISSRDMKHQGTTDYDDSDDEEEDIDLSEYFTNNRLFNYIKRMFNFSENNHENNQKEEEETKEIDSLSHYNNTMNDENHYGSDIQIPENNNNSNNNSNINHNDHDSNIDQDETISHTSATTTTTTTTMVMVTHNPDLECYADRILYVEDGRFESQVINIRQTRLVYEDYVAYLNQQENNNNNNNDNIDIDAENN